MIIVQGPLNSEKTESMIQTLAEKFNRMEASRKEWFIRYCMLKYFPKRAVKAIEEYVATGKDTEIAEFWRTGGGGFTQQIHPNGKIEFIRKNIEGHVTILETLEP